MRCDERNAQIICDRESGIPCKDIAIKYGISTQRVSQICNRHANRAKLEADPLMKALLESCEQLGYNRTVAKRAYNALTKHVGYILGGHVDCRTLDGVMAAHDDGYNFANVRQLGTRSLDVVEMMIRNIERASAKKYS